MERGVVRVRKGSCLEIGLERQRLSKGFGRIKILPHKRGDRTCANLASECRCAARLCVPEDQMCVPRQIDQVTFTAQHRIEPALDVVCQWVRRGRHQHVGIGHNHGSAESAVGQRDARDDRRPGERRTDPPIGSHPRRDSQWQPAFADHQFGTGGINARRDRPEQPVVLPLDAAGMKAGRPP